MDEQKYPARTKWTHCSVAQVGEGKVALRGRLLEFGLKKGRLQDETGDIELVVEANYEGIKAGDLVELKGYVEGGVLRVSAMHLLASGRDSWARGDWVRFNSMTNKVRDNLVLRAAVFDAVRQFFREQGFLEVETPILARGSAQEEEIELFTTEYREGKTGYQFYLAPSPELYMKRLLGIGMERIYQITRSFRNAEIGPLHNPEFAILEWYRAYASYEEVMDDTEHLLAFTAKKVTGKSSIVRQGQVIDLSSPWRRISVCDAFERWADIDLRTCTEAGSLFRRANELGYGSANAGDRWEDLFHKILLEKIEPELIGMGAVHLFDYPSRLAALAKYKDNEPGIAERTEAYVGGIELTNAYTELNDPVEQRRRFGCGVRDQDGQSAPADETFLEAMECGFPPAGGVALGLDRLVMLIAGASRLDEVIAFPTGY